MSLDLIAARSPWGRSWDPKVACAATLALVFLVGAAFGAVAMNFGHHSLHRAPFWTDSGKAVYLDRIKRDLNLSPAQTEKMESILDDFSQYYRNVLSDGKSRILEILNDDQRRKFEQMLAETQRR